MVGEADLCAASRKATTVFRQLSARRRGGEQALGLARLAALEIHRDYATSKKFECGSMKLTCACMRQSMGGLHGAGIVNLPQIERHLMSY